ncbi:hypothetical protein BLAHAN_06668 [Blautia hansenii DSM 20583]|uniref:Uncharacterized protein n=1 Tax=Blautia hansenii DSM 20583 TaxID=537007 RepID=C9LB60_BLAHA|nr:hypothetical protein BLAHAN_06668 [Blautia hansenii DSM 20583]
MIFQGFLLFYKKLRCCATFYFSLNIKKLPLLSFLIIKAATSFN